MDQKVVKKMPFIFMILKRKNLKKYYFNKIVGILSPSWSPDGKKIAFAGLIFLDIKIFIFLILNKEEVTKLTNDFYDDIDPSWSPDGNYCFFIGSDRIWKTMGI